MELTPSTRPRGRLGPWVLALPAAAVAVAAWDPARNGGPPLCPFRAVTGVPCPGCGLTRAAGALLRGRMSEALHVHPLIPFVAAQLLAIWLVVAFRRDLVARAPRWLLPLTLTVNVVAFCAVWAARLGTGSLDV